MQRLFFMFGQADRQAAMIHKQTWDIKGEKWFRERLHGNVPSPRAEVACTYNEVLDKVIFFGGYSPTVLTRGFPTYRADSTLVTDSKTGKTFLFGGYKNTTYVPSKNGGPSDSRSFVDLWQLRLDLPGGFERVDLEEAARTAKAGPWQRCFACGSTGPWKRCGGNLTTWCSGSCNGRVFFCDPECLKQGWKEHKEKHGCGKA
ncbi:hypothetical protein B0H16DRAFT_1667202 [Mycena metata]|uniref:Uncharacterized protein n=1 Tax=Mycena metata TaxID=1033252 RepID=A0AAD7H7Z2_9AGAR|nr:hypothetical protein B0H16DRAFT_1667202 [Mycena metata]